MTADHSPPQVTVRQATADDAATLVALLAEMDDTPARAATLDADGARKIMAAMATYPYFRAYLVFSDGIAVGTFSMLVFCSLTHEGTRQAVLDAVVISRASRGQGIGNVMLDHAVRIAGEAGCYKIALSSNLKRMDAHRFYENFGFTQHGISLAVPVPKSSG
ncbi:acetyltransferase (GNAT) family protein [Collimonas sp. PA-H2]|uniref:GNAT family N-acetyltransferase n=1 Tax=Collimonas sp. PA-H2 TaxID=1881062 RepID=UPI000BF83797|nr:GNAT family N-acetyltransferase [Collimonas sp. PA-H2]PFH09362.1 acetyltransferase (GNAT) family protein [Collimonas sp. PA-H2]